MSFRLFFQFSKVLAVLALAAVSFAAETKRIDSREVVLAVYDRAQGGEPLWLERQWAMPDATGELRLVVGDASAEGVPREFASERERWLGVRIAGEAEQPRVLLASLRPMNPANAARSNPSGPLLYSIVVRSSATAGAIPRISPTYTLENSLITDDGASIHIGGLAIAASGLVTFTGGQTFPGTTGVQSVTQGNSFIIIAGTPADPTVALNTSATDARYFQLSGVLPVASGGTGSATQNFVDLTTNQTVGGNKTFSNTITGAANIALPNTASASVGVITLGGTRFLHNFGTSNTFAGAGAGNMTMTGFNNSAFGSFALSSNSTGPGNSAFGASALSINTTGFSNSAFGSVALANNTTGPRNAAFGAGALTSNTTANDNSAFGGNALFLNTTGPRNSAFGGFALLNNSTGGDNSAFGFQALQSNTTDGNSAFGSNALTANTSGPRNSAFGTSALFSNQTGADNSAFGYRALFGNKAGGNSAFGSNALLANTIGTNNSAFGNGALQNNNDPNDANNASSNSAFGSNALTANTTGFTNSAFGSGALAQNSTGNNNSAFGNAALLFNNTGSQNAAFGTSALQNNTVSGNSAFGSQALVANNTGSHNSGFGNAALLFNLTGSDNSAFGFQAMKNNTFSGNSAFGSNALTANTSGPRNSAFGTSALSANTTANDNSAFGYQAMQNSTGGSNNAFGVGTLQANTGAGNAVFGSYALNVKTSGDSNTAMGNGALFFLLSGGSNTALGANAGSNYFGSESNNVDIGNRGTTGESNAIHIGDTQTSAFIAGIFGSTSASGTGVFVNSSGQLGTTTSSRRFKQAISDMAGESDVLMKLRPVAFYYKPELDETHTRQFGLVAEEVAQVAPELVLFGQDGQPETVRYHFVNAMLLNEVQKQRQLLEEQQTVNRAQEELIALQQSTNERQQQQIETLEAQLRAVLERVQAMEQK